MSTSPKSVRERLVLVGKKDGGNHPLTNLKKFNKLITLQNGRFTLSKVHVATRGLHVQFRHEGFLLFGCLTQKLQGQSSFSMVREALRIHLSVFWLRTSPKNFYQNFKSANIPNKEIEYQNSYLSRQHVVAGKVNQGGSDSNRHCNFLIPTSRICNRPQKVHFDSPTKNIVFRSTSGFSQYDIVFDSRETDENDQPMFGDVQDTESVRFTILALLNLQFNSARSVTCTTSVLVFTINSGRIAQSRSFIPTSSNLEFQWKTGTSLVGPKRKTVQWKMSCSTQSTNGGSNGCF